MKDRITILTPAYNRGYVINKAYESLTRQKQKNFEWLIIDDGSTDDTKIIINKFINENKIDIRYYKKENGGKHTALNFGIKKAQGSYIFILDSDDYLKDNAIEIMGKYISKYKNNSKIAAISFLRVSIDGKKIGTPMKDYEVISNYIDYRHNNNLKGDMAEIYRTDVLKKYPFPVFKKEKFLSEAIVWNKIALDYDCVFVNEPITVCDYLDDGLSKNFFKLVCKNPIGALENANVFLLKNFNIRIRLKNAILYNGYKIIAKKKYKKVNSKSNSPVLTTIMFIPGYLFSLYLKIQKSW